MQEPSRGCPPLPPQTAAGEGGPGRGEDTFDDSEDESEEHRSGGAKKLQSSEFHQ